MLCPNCNKLAILNTQRTCLRCQGKILNNLSCICDRCSAEQNMCSICLKRISFPMDANNKYIVRKGCRACGGGK